MEPLTPYNPELNRTLRRMENQGIPFNPNRRNLGEGACDYIPLPIQSHNHTHIENQLGDALKVQPPSSTRLQDYYKGNENIANSDGPLVLPPLPRRLSWCRLA